MMSELQAESVRAFVAIPLPESVRNGLAHAQSELRALLPPGSIAWTRPGNMHLTLRFLGPVDSVRIPEISQRLQATLAGFGGFELVCERLGCFPDLRFPRVVWAWIHDAQDRLLQLQRRVDSAVGEFATQPAEKRFVGHVTLGRPKRIQRKEAERLSRFVEAAVGRKFGGWRCEVVRLIQSDLTPTGSSYTTLDEFRL